MSDALIDDENNFIDDIAESISKSYDSKTKKKSSNNLGKDKKKMRRSRIIISDTNDIINDNKKEIYDSETKLKKSIISAICFNDSLNMTRQETSKVFLKRKIKAAFEREPIDKNKGFFNVPFLPMPGMFSALPTSQPVASNLPPQHSNRPVNPQTPNQTYNQNITVKFPSNPNLNSTSQVNPKNDQTVVINLNKSKEESNINSNNSIHNKIPTNSTTFTDNIPKITSTNPINQTSNSIIQSVSHSRYISPTSHSNSIQNKTINPSSKYLFNVNQSNQNQSDNPKNILDTTKHQILNINQSNQQVTSNSFNTILTEEKEIKYQINASNITKNLKNTHLTHNPDIKFNEQPSKIPINQNPLLQGAGQGLNLLNLSPEEFKKLRPEQIEQINKALRHKAQMQQQEYQQNMNNNNTNNPNNKMNQIGNPMMSSMQNPNSTTNFAELIKQQQNHIYMQIMDSYKNDPEKFKSETTTSELIKLQKLIAMSNKLQSENNLSNSQSNHFIVSNLMPKDGINTYQNNLQLLQTIQKHIQRRDINQNQNLNLINPNAVNNNMNIQITRTSQLNQQDNFSP